MMEFHVWKRFKFARLGSKWTTRCSRLSSCSTRLWRRRARTTSAKTSRSVRTELSRWTSRRSFKFDLFLTSRMKTVGSVCVPARNTTTTAARCGRSSSERLCCRSSSPTCCSSSPRPAHQSVTQRLCHAPVRCRFDVLKLWCSLQELPRFQELIFEDLSRFLLVENMYEEVVLQSVSKDIMMGEDHKKTKTKNSCPFASLQKRWFYQKLG